MVAKAPSTPTQKRVPKSTHNAQTDNPSPRKKPAGKRRKASKKKVTQRPESPESVVSPTPRRAQYRYTPYQRADPTPESEGDLPADPEDLETLDETAKLIYRRDRELMEYIESIKDRTEAILLHVNRTESKLNSHKGSMVRLQQYLHQHIGINDRPRGRMFPWGDGVAEADIDEPPEEEDPIPNPDLSPDLTRDRSGAFPTDLFSRNFVHPFISRDYARGDLGGPAPRSPGDDWEEEDFDRPETPPARMPSLPPGHEDENGLEYADVEDVIDTRSDLTKLPGDAAHRSDESIFNRSGVDFRIASDTGLLFPPSEGEFARISRDLRRESMGPTTATTSQPPVGFPYPHHPLAQSYVPSSSPPPTPQQEPQHLVPPLPVPRTPSPPSNFLSGKRKRVATPERGAEGSNAGKAVHPIRSAFRQVATRHNKVIEPPRKRQRLLTHRSTWDFPGFTNTGRAPAQPRVDSPTCGNSPEPSSWPAAAPQVQGEDSELEDSELEGSELDKSEVIEMLSRDVDQGESESEESTGNILEGLGEPRPSLPALTADNTQSATPNEAQSEVHTPTVALMPPKVPPSDVFGPIVLSARANKISDRLSIDVPKDTGGSAVLAGSERGSGNISSKSSKSARFSLDGRIEKEDHKVFRKTPVRPRASSSMWIKEAELALSAEAQAESEDVAKPLSPPKKKRAIGARVRRPRPAAPGEIGPTVNHEDDLPSIPDNQTPQKPRRGESVSVQPIPKTPVRKSSRSRK